ncbi:NUDIX hydrolase [Cellulomonas dongxiuzhuiae]|uniref:NUDIX hydrolase n=1 Tax=Cellulomonas dongxiuzhuiae TaxID=2819979 RepID=A0ABX8GHN6_9CELL|nr:NUDIX hydrolase [Cellulomonas dongxiuzhuiae]MBO3094358.1 NUDIX hydrolase [Cellulomonas dongxiuzhuiae]QWC15395.1 NUDIX hydrolase [Cellulomonas dongxiuzhuiae]
MKASSPAPVQAAGALVWRLRAGHLQVALVHRPRYRDWSWPKGKLDPGENAPVAAVREVEEETGMAVVLGLPLPGLEYRLSDGRQKVVHYWAARVGGRGDDAPLGARPPVRHAARTEIDAWEWFDVEDAARRVTRGADRRPLDSLVEAHARGRLRTRALVVARHGQARKRSLWGGEEADRPLTGLGLRQAAAAVPVLAAFGVGRVVTSRWERCTATVAPYAAAAGLEPQVADVLTEARHDESPARVGAMVRELIESPTDTVVCTHRPVLPTVLGVLAEHSRRHVADALPRENPFLAPAELLVAHTGPTPRGARVLAVERHTSSATAD